MPLCDPGTTHPHGGPLKLGIVFMGKYFIFAGIVIITSSVPRALQIPFFIPSEISYSEELQNSTAGVVGF